MKCPKCFSDRQGSATQCVCGNDFPLDTTPPISNNGRRAMGSAIVILVSFFLPWTQLLGLGLSGYDLAKLGSYANWVWVVPLSACFLLYHCIAGNSVVRAQYFAGIAPWLGLLYGLVKVGENLFHILSIGAYLTLIAASALLAQNSSENSQDFLSILTFGLLGNPSAKASQQTSLPDDTLEISPETPPVDDALDETACLECSTVIPAGTKSCPKCGWSYTAS